MRWLSTWTIAWRALRRNMMRTCLTMLGMIIGVGAVIAMVAIGNGAKTQLEAQIAQMGQNTILVMSGANQRGGVHRGWGSSPTLTIKDYEAIRSEVAGIAGVTPEVRSGAQLAAGNQNYNTTVYGVGEDYLGVRAWKLQDGEMFTDQDVRTAAKVALLGKTVSEGLFGEGSCVGQTIRIRNAPFVIVGVLKPKGMNMMGMDQDDLVLVPWTSSQKRLSGGTTFRSLSVQAESAESVPFVVNDITELLRQRHRTGDGKEDDFTIRTQQEMTEMATSTTQTMTILLGAIAGVSLLVGGIGIMNIMLVSVTERTREIGVRLAVGALGRDILLQFLVEAVLLSVAGGLIGIALGYGTACVVSAKLGWSTLVSLNSVGLSFLVSVFIGVFFGFYPARKAARLDPIVALRYE